MEKEKKFTGQTKRNILFALFVFLVLVTEGILFYSYYSKSDNINDDNAVLSDIEIDLLNSESNVYKIENNKISIMNVQRRRLDDSRLIISMTLLKNTNDNLNLMDVYEVNVYDENNNVLHRQNGGIFSALKNEYTDVSFMVHSETDPTKIIIKKLNNSK